MTYAKYIFGIPFVGLSLLGIGNYQEVKKIVSCKLLTQQNKVANNEVANNEVANNEVANNEVANNEIIHNSKHIRPSITRLKYFWGY